MFSILSRRPPITKLVSMYQRASCAKHSRPSASLELPAQSMRTRRACRLQAARRACLLPRSSTNSSKNNLTVWAAYTASTAHATRFGRIEVRCEPRGCPTVFSWRIPPYATSTPTRFGPRTRGPQLGSALAFLHSKAPFHVRFKYWGKTSCVANHASVR